AEPNGVALAAVSVVMEHAHVGALACLLRDHGARAVRTAVVHNQQLIRKWLRIQVGEHSFQRRADPRLLIECGHHYGEVGRLALRLRGGLYRQRITPVWVLGIRYWVIGVGLRPNTQHLTPNTSQTRLV